MGGILSRGQPPLATMNEIDRNRDNVVTKDEFDAWEKRFRESIAVERNEIEVERNRLSKRIDELESENRRLLDINSQLEGRLAGRQTGELSSHDDTEDAENTDKSDQNELPPPPKLSPESLAIIDKYVENLLQNPDINNGWIPDALERPLYRNMLQYTVALTTQLLANTSINFLGHTATIALGTEVSQVGSVKTPIKKKGKSGTVSKK